MTDEQIRAHAVALYDRFTHDGGDRRAFMRQLALLAGGTVAADVLLAAIAANPAAAAIVPADDRRIKAQTVTWVGSGGRSMSGYSVDPAKPRKGRPAVMVIHENRGLTDHIRDVARRVALLGYAVVAPDFLSPDGGTPRDEDAARTAMGKLDLAVTVADAVTTLNWLKWQGAPRVAAIGFCWGGAMVNRVAIADGSPLNAGIAYYGPGPDPGEAHRVHAAMLLHYAGLDDRVNTTGQPWTDALKAARVTVDAYVYPGVNHAFNNDTAVGRYEEAAADLAWARTTAFLTRHIGKGTS